MNQEPARKRRKARRNRPAKPAPSQEAPTPVAGERATTEQHPGEPATDAATAPRGTARTAASREATSTAPRNAGLTLDHVMDKAAHPGRAVIYVVFAAIVVVGGLWPQYVVDPTSVGGAAHGVVAVVISAVLFLSFSTLTLLGYCLLVGGATETNTKFLAAVLNRAGIGAVLGTLLGVRLAPALLDPASGTHVTFPEYLSSVGNAVTLLSLVLISTFWPYSLGPFVQAVVESLERTKIRVPARARRWAASLFAFAVNGAGAFPALKVLIALF